jgi:hypothetical protein
MQLRVARRGPTLTSRTMFNNVSPGMRAPSATSAAQRCKGTLVLRLEGGSSIAFNAAPGSLGNRTPGLMQRQGSKPEKDRKFLSSWRTI